MTEAKRFYHINYVVIQGFPALRKAVTTHVKKYDIFSLVFDIANQLTRPSRLAPFGQVDGSKAFIILNPRSFVEFFRIMAAKTLENSYRLQIVAFKLS